MAAGEAKRRHRGDGGVYWNESRQRFIAQETVGYNASGKRIVRFGSGKTEAEALRKMRKAVKDFEAGLVVDARRYTVGQAVEEWLRYGQGSRVGESTLTKKRTYCNVHIVPYLGSQKLVRLTATHVDEWLEDRAQHLASNSLQQVRRYLRLAIRRAQAKGLVERNVVDLTDCPKGQKPGRPSKSLTFEQCVAILVNTRNDPMHAYIVVSLLAGLRTEEVRALRWDNVDLDGNPEADPPVPPHVLVWRSVRKSGDTKTEKSRRTLALPKQVVEVLRTRKARQAETRLRVGKEWAESGLVFTTLVGTQLDAANVRRSFRLALRLVEGIDPEQWTPRELRHSFVSLLSQHGVAVEEIARLVGHAGGSKVTELIYRHELRPVIETGASAMDELFGDASTNGAGSGA